MLSPQLVLLSMVLDRSEVGNMAFPTKSILMIDSHCAASVGQALHQMGYFGLCIGSHNVLA